MEPEISSAQWLQEEINFINTEKAGTLNGRLKASFVSCDETAKEITLSFPLQDWQVNGLGTLHGGMLNVMMDLAMSMVVYCFSRKSIPPTITMTSNYIRPVAMDGDVYVTAKLTSLGRRNATAYSEAILPATGKTAATAVGTYSVL